MKLRLWFEQFRQDLFFGLRNLARTPSFTAIAVASLALGAGASTAMYSVIHAVVLDPFPYKDVGSLMSIKVWEPDQRGFRLGYNVDQYLELATRSTIFDGVLASTISDVVWNNGGTPQRLRGNHCSVNALEVMGVPPLHGRVAGPGDAADGAEPVAVLGYRFWQRQFSGDPAVVGSRMQLNGKMRTVIGVMPPRFMFRGADVYVPLIFHRGEVQEGVRDVHVLGRLRAGVTGVQAEADLKPIVEELQRQSPNEFPKKWRVGLLSFMETFPSGIRETLWILFAAVGLLLLIACVNVSNLLLSRAASRQKEIAVRASLGASRLRLIRQLLAESLVLGLGGGLLGVALAFAGLRAIIAVVPPNTIPDESHIEINGAVLLFTLAISLGTALLFGLAPALHLSRGDLADPLKASSRGTTGGLSQRLMRQGLVAAEVALSLMLLVGASLMVRTLIAVQKADLGMNPETILTLRVPLAEQRYPTPKRRSIFFEELLTRVAMVPGVSAVGINSGLAPLYSWSLPVEVAGRTQQDGRPVSLLQTNETYMQAMGGRRIAGRYFSRQEVSAEMHLAVVNESFVKRFGLGANAVGTMVRIPRMREPPLSLANDAFEIVGVTRDIPNRLMTNETWPEIRIPYTITAFADRLYVLAAGDPLSLSKAVAAQVYSIDRDQPVMEVRTVQTILDENLYSRPKFNLVLFGIFAGLGLTLALLGVYGVISNAVAQRTQEIGIRLALGARLGQVVGMVLAMGARVVGLGVVIGLAGSLLSARFLSKLVVNVSTFDPLSFSAVALLLFGAGLAACLWPAYRASRVDPVRALREE